MDTDCAQRLNGGRSRFLCGDWYRKQHPIRPPWSVPEAYFDGICTNCGECIDVCSEKIIALGRGKLPVVDFQRGACTFCGECARVCESGALDRTRGLPWRHKVGLYQRCLAEKGVMCRSCGDACEEEAIRFRLIVGGFARPEFDHELCTGCGGCVASCPEGAIDIREATS